ncbi:DUF5956 family protein [Gordonia sp. HS-NH1]|uniref:DUF5956 family protein n=1 Tax=Gordonia sp. HS-NH1 TaxID=1435068 RepID=UPI003FA5A1CF
MFSVRVPSRCTPASKDGVYRSFDGRRDRALGPIQRGRRQRDCAAINAYIGDAGVPPMPQGFLWHILVPDSIKDGSALDRSLVGKNMQLRPADVLATIRDVYGQLLSDR